MTNHPFFCLSTSVFYMPTIHFYFLSSFDDCTAEFMSLKEFSLSIFLYFSRDCLKASNLVSKVN